MFPLHGVFAIQGGKVVERKKGSWGGGSKGGDRGVGATLPCISSEVGPRPHSVGRVEIPMVSSRSEGEEEGRQLGVAYGLDPPRFLENCLSGCNPQGWGERRPKNLLWKKGEKVTVGIPPSQKVS